MVKVFEVTEKLPYDLVDDTCVHMRNDSDFYRREYFPAMVKLAELHAAKKNSDPQKVLMPMIEKGIVDYCRKYKIARHPDDLYTNNERNAIMNKIHTEEMKQIEKGEYK